MTGLQVRRCDAASGAGRAGSSGLPTLGVLAAITFLLALGTALVALPLRERRERRMNEAARTQLTVVLAAIEEFRGRNYRLPATLRELESFGYAASPSVEICAFRRVPDRRRFDDHVRIVLRHRASETALMARYPQAGEPFMEIPARAVCDTSETPVAVREEA